jgi:hypothetical protein
MIIKLITEIKQVENQNTMKENIDKYFFFHGGFYWPYHVKIKKSMKSM